MEFTFINAYTPFLVRKDQVAGAFAESQTLVIMFVNSATPVRLQMAGRESTNAALAQLRAFLEAR